MNAPPALPPPRLAALRLAAPRLAAQRLHAGVWEGVLTGAGAAPAVEVLHEGRPVPGVVLSPVAGSPGDWALRVPVPAEAVSDGLNILVLRAGGGTEALAHLALVAGAAVEGDLRAEVELLRAELDMLKRAFRRHCTETAGADGSPPRDGAAPPAAGG